MPIRIPLILSFAAALFAAPGAAAADTAVSSNWAGYAVTASDVSGSTSFSRVSSRWIEPTATCTTSDRT